MFHSSTVALMLLALCVACQSSSRRSPASIEKMTGTSTASELIEIETHVNFAPRRPAEMEQALFLSPGVHDCLRASPRVRDPAFSLQIEGHLTYSGEVDSIHINAEDEGLVTCLTRESESIEMGRGRTGDFKMQIYRPRDQDRRKKNLFLDLQQIQKWQ